MRSTIPRLVRVIKRSQLPVEQAASVSVVRPPPARSDVRRESLIELLLKRKEKMGDQYPPNIRIEPVLTKQAFENVPAETREELKELLRER